MAAAAPLPLASSVEKTNGSKLSRLLIDGGTTVLRREFDYYHPPANLAADLDASKTILVNLLHQGILKRPEWNKLFPPSRAKPDSNTFDITLLFLLLTDICGLSPPRKGWGRKPHHWDTSYEANLAHIKFFRNKLYGHISTTGIDTPTFTALWKEISAALVALGLDQAEIDRLKVERCGEEHYIDLLLEWADSDKDIKSQLEEVHQVQSKVQQTVDKVERTQNDSKAKLEKVHQVQTKTQQTVDKVERTQEEDHQTLQDSKAKLEDVHQVQTKVQQTVDKVERTQKDSKAKLEKVHQVQTKVQQTVNEVERTQKDSKAKLEEVHQVQTKTQQTVDKVERTQEEDHQTLQDSKAKLEEVHQLQTKVQQTADKVQRTQEEDHQTLQHSKVKLEEVHQVQTKVHQTVDKVERTQEEDHQTLQDSKAKLEEVHQLQTKVQQTADKVQRTQEEDHQTLQHSKVKLEEVHQVQTKVHQTVDKVERTQEKDHETLQNSKAKLEEVHKMQLEDRETLQDSKAKLEEVHKIEITTHHVVTEARQTQLEDSKAIQDTKAKVEEVSKCLDTLQQQLQQKGEALQEERERNREDEVLKKLAKIDALKDVKHHADSYVEGTRLSIFAKVENWLDDRRSPNRVMVISGNAGMGKSVISAVMCKRMLEAGRLSGSHFCRHNKARHRNPKVMLQSLACHLSDSLPGYKKALVEKLSRNLGVEINNMEVRDLFEVLFEEPLNSLNDPGSTYLMVIDGLDESEYEGRNELLDVIANYFNKLPLWIRFLVTTRPEINIADKLRCSTPVQLEPNNEENLKDIYLCFQKQLGHVLQCENQEIILQKLVQKSEGVMLYAHYLVDFIKKKNVPLVTPELLDSALPSGISSVYQSYLERLENDLRKELKVTEDQFLNFLSAVAAAREPLPLGFVSKLLISGISPSAVQRKVNRAIACVSAVLPIQDECIHFFHKSGKDWLIDKSTYGQHNFSVDEKEGHHILAMLCSDELDDVKRKGVDSAQFSDTTKYALQHGVQHMLELEEDSRASSLEEVVKKYVLDLELVYAKLCVNVTAALEDILCVQKQEGTKSLLEGYQTALSTLLFLLRKHSKSLTELPNVIFQTVLNEGGPELSPEALSLLETKHSEIPYMEYLHKKDLQGLVQTRFECSVEVACFDVSPNLEYMVCECVDATIQLWSIPTGNLIWKRPVIVPKHYSMPGAYRIGPLTDSDTNSDSPLPVLCFYRSVVFHPTEDLVLPGVLNHAYNINGDWKPLFPSSNCSFSVCSISGDGNQMLTDCPDDAKSIIMWSLINGSEISRFTGNENILSFAWSRDGRLLAISHATGLISLVDVIDGFKILALSAAPKVCGMIKFSLDCQFLFCYHLPAIFVGLELFRVNVKMENQCNFSFDDFSTEVCYQPWEFESRREASFLLGDPICYKINDHVAEFGNAFVLNKESVLRVRINGIFIDMLYVDELLADKDLPELTKGKINKLCLNGETVFFVSGAEIIAWDISSGEVNGDKCTSSRLDSLVAVRDGVLFATSSSTLELWNVELSSCIKSWTDLGNIDQVLPISEDRVACDVGDEVIILDTTSGEIVSRIKPFPGRVVACNSKCQLITFVFISNDPLYSIQLWDGQRRWERHFSWSPLPVMLFSPAETFVVTAAELLDEHTFSDWRAPMFVLDAVSGQTLHILRAGQLILDYKFVSEEECVVSSKEIPRGYCLRLFNINSGDLLSVIALESDGYCLAACPSNRLIAIALRDSKHKFQIIQVKLPQDKDSQQEEQQDQHQE